MAFVDGRCQELDDSQLLLNSNGYGPRTTATKLLVAPATVHGHRQPVAQAA